MENPHFQEALSSLEERFHQLDEWNKECSAAYDKEVDKLRQRLGEKEAELLKVLGERDARAKEKDETQQAAQELRKQLLEVQAMEKEKAQQQLAEKSEELGKTQQDLELVLLQLHQVQEELENYFLLSRHQDELLASYSGLQERIAVLFSKSSDLSSVQ